MSYIRDMFKLSPTWSIQQQIHTKQCR